MNREKIVQQRGEIIDKFVNIEWMINAIICQHYFKKVRLDFVLEALYDEYFSFALKRRILEKIFPKIENSQIQKLNKLNTIRNYFAHCTDGLSIGKKGEEEKGEYIPDPRNHSKPLDFDLLHKEFIEIERDVNRYLYKLYTDLGGESLKDTI